LYAHFGLFLALSQALQRTNKKKNEKKNAKKSNLKNWQYDLLLLVGGPLAS